MNVNMSRNLVIAVVGLVVFVGVVAYFTFRTDRSTSAAPDGTFWVCTNPSCKNTFVLSLSEVAAHHKAHYGERIPCPKCDKKETVRGERCEKCHTIFLPDASMACPSCKTPLPGPARRF
jgi:hypothetical protein